MIIPVRTMSVLSLVLFILLAHVHAEATSVEYDLTINQQQVNITGKAPLAQDISTGKYSEKTIDVRSFGISLFTAAQGGSRWENLLN